MKNWILLIVIFITVLTFNCNADDHGNWIDKGRYYENNISVPSISHMKFSVNGKYLYTYGTDKVLRKWDINKGEVLREIQIFIENARYVDVNSDETRYFVCTDVQSSDEYELGFDVNVFDFDTEKLLFRFDGANNYEIAFWGSMINGLGAFYHPVRDEIIVFFGTIDFTFNSRDISSGSTYIYDGKNGEVLVSEGSTANFAVSNDKEKFAFISRVGQTVRSTSPPYSQKQLGLGISDNNFDNLLFLGGASEYRDPQRYYYEGLGALFMDLTGVVFSSNDSIVYANCSNKNEVIYSFAVNQNFSDSIFTMRKDTVARLEAISVSEDNRFITGLVNIFRGSGTTGDNSGLYYLNVETHQIVDSISFPGKAGQNFICKSPDQKTFVFTTKNGNVDTSNLIIINPDFDSNELKADFKNDYHAIKTEVTVNFFDYSTGNPDSWEWDFGDGTKSSEKNPTHQYKNPGTYDVSLMIKKGNESHFIKRDSYIKVLDPSSVENEKISVENGFFPNPISDNATLKYKLDSPAKVTITIYDSYGREALTRDLGYKTTGLHESEINTSALAPGMYYYTIQSGSEVMTGKFVVVR